MWLLRQRRLSSIWNFLNPEAGRSCLWHCAASFEGAVARDKVDFWPPHHYSFIQHHSGKSRIAVLIWVIWSYILTQRWNPRTKCLIVELVEIAYSPNISKVRGYVEYIFLTNLQQTASREEVLPQLLGCHQEALKVHSWHFWQFFSARSNLCHLVVASPSPPLPPTSPDTACLGDKESLRRTVWECERVMRIRASEQDQIRWLASRRWGGGAFLGGRQSFQREEMSLEKKE